MIKTISIVIPAYNEEKRIGNTLEEYGKFFNNLKKKKILDSQILIVINNTTDKTPEIVKKYSKKYKIIKSLNFKQGGKGFAIIEGFKHSFKNKKNKLIGFVDADMATSPEAYYELVNNIEDYYAIIGSRYIKGAVVNPKQTWKRIFVSRIFNFLIRVLFLMPFNDTQCGAKIIKREALEKITSELLITKWAFDVDLLYRLQKYRFNVREFPTTWSDREYSKINFMKAGPLMALSIIRLRIVNSPFKEVMRLYDSMPEWMKVHHRL